MRLASCAKVGRSAGSLAMHSLARATTAALAWGSQARLSSLMATAYTICGQVGGFSARDFRAIGPEMQPGKRVQALE